MIKYISLIFFLLFTGITCGYGQSRLIFTGTYEGVYHKFDSLLIQDLNTGSTLLKHYPDTVLKLLITGTENVPGNPDHLLSQNFPNPFENNTRFNVFLSTDDKVDISVLNFSGQVVLRYKRQLSPGDHSFTFTGGGERMYLLSVRTSTASASIKMMTTGEGTSSSPQIEYNGNLSYVKSTRSGKGAFDFNTGDDLVFTGYMTDGAGEVVTDTIWDAPDVSKTYSFSFERKKRIVILMYHKITDTIPVDEYERTSADFEKDLIYLRDHDYQLLTMEDLALLKSGEKELTSNGIIITFDDGYESNYSKAFPLLTKYNMPATFFLVTEWMETEGFVTWSEVWLMSQFTNGDGDNLFRMGSHTSSHPYLEQSSQYFATHDEYINFLNTELGDSKTWIEDITGQPDIFLSLPYGDGLNNTDIINTAKANGYSGIRTSEWSSVSVSKLNLYSLPSIPILYTSPINSIEDYLKY